MDVELQWLRRRAVRELVSRIAAQGSHLRRHLDRLIWQYLRFAICVPRDCPTVSEALQKLPSWPATVRLSAGVYHEHFVIDRPVELVGSAVGHVVFKRAAAAQFAVVRHDSPGEASLQNLTFEGPGCGVEVANGSLRMKNCKFSSDQGVIVKFTSTASLHGCTFTECQRTACIFRDDAVGELDNCTFESNRNVCLLAREQASVTIADCFMQRNAAPVLQFRDKATVEVRRARLQSNNGCGVLVRGQVSAHIESCELRGHKMAAVAFQHDSKGTLRGNLMQENDGAAVLISGQAFALVEGNTLSKNGKSAPVIEFSNSSGKVRAKVVSKREDSQNQLTHKLAYISGQTGEEWVDVDEKQKILRNKTGETNIPYTLQEPMRAGSADDGEGGTLKGASLGRGTRRCVIGIRDTAKATIRENNLEQNDGYGILVSDQASPIIERNLLSACRCSAVHMDGTSSAHIVSNHFINNSAAGIDVRDEAAPKIEDNTFRGHKQMAIRVAGKSSCIIRRNSLLDNVCYALVVCDSASPCVEQNVMTAGKKPAMLVRSLHGTYAANQEVETAPAGEGRGKRCREVEPEAAQAQKSDIKSCVYPYMLRGHAH